MFQLVDGSKPDIVQNRNESNMETFIQSSKNNPQSGEEIEKESPSPASSSVSISSENASTEANPPHANKLTSDITALSKNFQTKYQNNDSTIRFNNHNIHQTLTPNRYIPPVSVQSLSNNNTPCHANSNGSRFLNQQANIYSNFNSPEHQFHLNNQVYLVNDIKNNTIKNSQQYKKQLSQSFRDILENTLLINGFDDQLSCTQLNNKMINHINNSTLKQPNHDFNAKMNALQQQLLANKITSNNNRTVHIFNE